MRTLHLFSLFLCIWNIHEKCSILNLLIWTKLSNRVRSNYFFLFVEYINTILILNVRYLYFTMRVNVFIWLVYPTNCETELSVTTFLLYRRYPYKCISVSFGVYVPPFSFNDLPTSLLTKPGFIASNLTKLFRQM